MKWLTGAAVAGAMLGVVAAGVAAAAAASGNVAYRDAVAAIVRDEVITVYDLHQETWIVEQNLRQTFSGEELERRIVELRRNAANQLVERELIHAEFQELQGRVPPELLQRRLDGIIQAQSGGDRRAFETTLRQQGLSMNELRQRLRKQLAVELLVQEMVVRPVHISPDMIRDRLRQNPRMQLQVISLPAAGRYSGKIEATVRGIRQRLANHEDFAAVATEYSEDFAAKRGGDWGWFDASELKPAFLAALEGLAVGTVAEPFHLDGNTYIVRLAGRQQGELAADEEDIRNKVEEGLRREEETRRYREFVDKLRQKFYVRTFF